MKSKAGEEAEFWETRQREDEEVARLLESTKLDMERRRAAWAVGGHGSESRKQIRLDLING